MSITPVLTRALRYGGIWALIVAVGAGLIGLAVAGVPGLVGGLLGAVLAAVFLGMTAGSMLIAGRVTKGDLGSPVFFAIVLGVWFVKLVVFLVVTIVLRGDTWLSPAVFGFAVIAAVIGSLATDVIAYVRARVPYVSDVALPGETKP
jgi:fructose-specific phosphotransferase system IIC component